jgi:putative transcriptional regulator
MVIKGRVGMTTSKDILEAIGLGKGPSNFIVTLGYAGWAQGQLEHELAQNAWLSVPATDHILFDLPAEDRLAAAMSLLGVDYASLSADSGHA